jgi:hypothetical protein
VIDRAANEPPGKAMNGQCENVGGIGSEQDGEMVYQRPGANLIDVPRNLTNG